MIEAVKASGITWECAKKREEELGDLYYQTLASYPAEFWSMWAKRELEPRAYCVPPPEVQEQIHAVIIKAFGEAEATKIRAAFDQCKGNAACIHGSFTEADKKKMIEAVKASGITWECAKKREEELGDLYYQTLASYPAEFWSMWAKRELEPRAYCVPPPEVQEQIHAVIVKAFGETEATKIRAAFDQCKGNAACIHGSFTEADKKKMIEAVKASGITWEC